MESLKILQPLIDKFTEWIKLMIERESRFIAPITPIKIETPKEKHSIKIKMFCDLDISDLEHQVNTWIERQLAIETQKFYLNDIILDNDDGDYTILIQYDIFEEIKEVKN